MDTMSGTYQLRCFVRAAVDADGKVTYYPVNPYIIVYAEVKVNDIHDDEELISKLNLPVKCYMLEDDNGEKFIVSRDDVVMYDDIKLISAA